jgi:hypothetical protein
LNYSEIRKNNNSRPIGQILAAAHLRSCTVPCGPRPHRATLKGGRKSSASRHGVLARGACNGLHSVWSTAMTLRVQRHGADNGSYRLDDERRKGKHGEGLTGSWVGGTPYPSRKAATRAQHLRVWLRRPASAGAPAR